MKLPLYAKLGLCLLLNLALAAGVLASGFGGLGWNLLLSAPVRDRLVEIAQEYTDDLAQSPGTIRFVNEKYQARYGVDFMLRLPEGLMFHGGPRDVPLGPPSDRPDRPHGDDATTPMPGDDASAHGPLVGPPPMRERSQRAGFLSLHRVGGAYELRIPSTLRENTPAARGREVSVRAHSLGALIGFLGVADGARLLLILVGLSLLIWAPLLIGVTRSLMSLTQTAGRIAEGRFDARSAIRRRDEIGTLAAAINGMAQRLESFVGRQRAFMADVAHEVTSPLARMRIGLGLLEHGLDARQKQILQDIEEDAEQMSQMLNELLLFSRAGMESGAGAPGPVNLAAVARDALMQENAQQRVRCEIPDDLSVSGHRALLTRALANLVRNALRYAPPEEGPVEIGAARDGGQLRLSVRDRGPGVPEQVLENLGQPFYRPEVARHRDTGGFGLGLAIVRRCVESCGGNVAFANREGGGFEALITLPASD